MSDHWEDEIALFTDQFDDSDDLLDLAEALLSPSEDLITDVNDLKFNRWMSTAVGIQLDRLGDILGVERLGRDDDAYRAALKFQIFINVSKTQPEVMIEATRVLTEANMVRYWENYPAGFQVFTDGPNVIDVSGAIQNEFVLALNDGALLELDDGSQFSVKISLSPPQTLVDFLSGIAPAAINFIAVSFSLGIDPIFGFSGDFASESATFLLDDGGELELFDGTASPMSYYSFFVAPNPDGWLGFSELLLFFLALDDEGLLELSSNLIVTGPFLLGGDPIERNLWLNDKSIFILGDEPIFFNLELDDGNFLALEDDEPLGLFTGELTPGDELGIIDGTLEDGPQLELDDGALFEVNVTLLRQLEVNGIQEFINAAMELNTFTEVSNADLLIVTLDGGVVESSLFILGDEPIFFNLELDDGNFLALEDDEPLGLFTGELTDGDILELEGVFALEERSEETPFVTDDLGELELDDGGNFEVFFKSITPINPLLETDDGGLYELQEDDGIAPDLATFALDNDQDLLLSIEAVKEPGGPLSIFDQNQTPDGGGGLVEGARD